MSGRGKRVDLELVSFLLDFFTSYCSVICTVCRTSNHGRAHIRCLIRCLMPVHTCVCKRDTAAGSTSKKQSDFINFNRGLSFNVALRPQKHQQQKQQQTIRFIRV